MGEDNIIVGEDENRDIDKMQIALMIRDSTYDGELHCGLLENVVINSCDLCNLKSICEGLERVAQDYLIETTKVVNSFSFQ